MNYMFIQYNCFPMKQESDTVICTLFLQFNDTKPVVMPASCTTLQTVTVGSEVQNKLLQNRFILTVHFYIQVIIRKCF